MGITYRDAGVDIDAATDLVGRIGKLAGRTKIPELIGGIGGFAGLCALPSGMKEPILVSGTDGVGTKLKVAFATGKHDTIGIDLVAMCVNDVLTVGARPLFFLDYFGTGKLQVDVGESVIRGIVEGCVRAGCALLGGETAELPGMYADGEYDLAGFSVGVVERENLLDGKRCREGDVILGVASSGLHSNGYSLARRVVDGEAGLAMSDRMPIAGETRTVGEVLLEPTRIYARAVQGLVSELGQGLHAMAHITGGGLPENLPRVVPIDLGARIELGSYERPALFRWLAEKGPIEEGELIRTFNCGVGFAVIVAESSADQALEILRREGETAWRLGRLESAQGPERLRLCGAPR